MDKIEAIYKAYINEEINLRDIENEHLVNFYVWLIIKNYDWNAICVHQEIQKRMKEGIKDED